MYYKLYIILYYKFIFIKSYLKVEAKLMKNVLLKLFYQMFIGHYIYMPTTVLSAGGTLRGRMWRLPDFRELIITWASWGPSSPFVLPHEPRSFPVKL